MYKFGRTDAQNFQISLRQLDTLLRYFIVIATTPTNTNTNAANTKI